jgi:outer membrane protein assembly factor BamB
VLRAIGIRVLVYGGLGLLLAGLLGYVRLPSFDDDIRPTQPTADATLRTDVPGWPHLRGPNLDSTSPEDLADAWPDEGPPVLWVRDMGQGYSGFSAVGGRVWTQEQTLYGLSVLCLDGNTGATVWEHRYGWPYEAAGMYPGPRSTPTWHDGRVYYAGPRGLVGCLRARDGLPLWSVNVNEHFEGRGTDFGYSCSPTVVDDKVILPVGGQGASMVALNPEDGSTVWADGDQPASYTSALPITLRGQKLVLGYLQNALALHDRDSGRPLWLYKLSTGYDEHASLPLYDEPYLMVSGPFRAGADLFELSTQASDQPNASDGITARRIWHSQKMSNDVVSSVLVEGYVYGFDLRDIQSKARRPSRGEYRCLDFRTGEIQWSSDQPGHASAIAADGKLLLFNDRGEVLLVRATPAAYEELARVTLFEDEICWTAPALDDGRLYLRSPTRAACLYVGKPERLAEDRLANARSASEIPTTRKWDVTPLVSGERDCPADPPDGHELLRWYTVSMLGVICSAALPAVLAWAVAVVMRSDIAARCARYGFWSALVVLGMIATPLGNRLGTTFVFTWPVALFALHQIALAGILRAYRQRRDRWTGWLSAACASAFIAACLIYFDLCRRLDLAVMWVFLIGFVPSWPVSLPAARQLDLHIRPLRNMIWTAVAFSAYYWVSAAFAAWYLCH